MPALTERKHGGAWRVIRTVLLAISLLVLAGLFYITVIVVHPRPDPEHGSAEALPPMPAERVTDAADLSGLIKGFPAPALAVMPTARIILTEGVRTDVPVGRDVGRMLTLRYALPEGGEITVTSLWPLEALPTLGTEGWHLMPVQVPEVSGMPGMAMQKGASLRLLYENGDTLYAAEGTNIAWETLMAAAAVMQLYQ